MSFYQLSTSFTYELSAISYELLKRRAMRMSTRRRHLFTSWFMGLAAFIGMQLSAQAADIDLVPSVALTTEYNDNVTFDDQDEDADFIGIATPSLKLDYSTELLDISATGALDAYGYYDNSDLNTIHHRYRADSRYKLTERSALKANLGFIKDTTLESELEETGIVNRRVNRNRYDAGTGALYRISEVMNTDLGYRYSRVDYSSRGFEGSDTHTITFLLNRNLDKGINTISLKPRYAYRDSDRNQIDDYTVSLGWTHRYTEIDILRVFLGVRYTEVEQKETRDEFSDWGGVADVSLKRSWEISSVLIGLSSDVRYDANGQAIQVNRLYWDLTKGLSYRWGLGLKGGFYYTRSGEDFNDEDDFFFEITPSAYYRITENHTLQLAYSYAREDDEELSDSFVSDRNRLWLTLTFVFPQKL
jgi:hypothetical protein